jgi:hypothetical protein
MADVDISKYRAQVVRDGFRPSNPGFVESEGQNPVDPAGSGQNHLPVTIAAVSTGLAITDAQVLGGAGTVGQYIRGDGSLADFPATTGGGSSVSYYLNGSVSQGTIGGVAYLELNKMPVFGAGTDITRNSNGYIASFITDAGDPNKLLIPAGNWNLETYFSASSGGGSPTFYVELYKYDGTTFTLLASSATSPELIAFGTNLNPYFSTLAVPQTTLTLTDRLALRYYVNTSGRTITLHTENDHLCQVITTFTTGLTALNGLTSQVQFFAVGTSGTDFNIASATDTHTFNLPTASATNRGALSSGDWSTFNAKENAITGGTTAQYFRGDKTFQTLNTSVVPELTNLYYTEARVNANTNVAANTAARHNAVTLGTANGLSLSTQVLSLGLASAGVTGALSGTDWSTFNGKQNALTNPVTGTGNANFVPKFTGTSTIGNSNIQDNGSLVSVAVTTLFSSNVTAYGTMVVGIDNIVGNKYVTLNPSATSAPLNIQGIHAGVGAYSLSLQASGGNLLIGTGGDNGSRLQVNGSATITTFLTAGSYVNGIGGFRLKETTLGGGSRNWVLGNDVSAFGDFGILQSTTQTGSSYTAPFYISPAGRVGIGTTTDAGFRLDVNGTGRFVNNVSGGATNVLTITNAGSTVVNTESRLFLSTVTGNDRGAYISAIITSASNDNALIFATNSAGASPTEKVRITNNGNFGIGTISPATYSGWGGLDVRGTNGGHIIVANTGGTNRGEIFTDGNGFNVSAQTNNALLFKTNDTTRLTLASTGAATFSSTLEAQNNVTIRSNANAGLSALTTSTTGFSFIDLINNGASGRNYQIGLGGNSTASGYANNLYFDLVGVGNIMTLTSGRNVLIGTQTDNGARLQVNGTAIVSSTLTANGYRQDFGPITVAHNTATTFYTNSGLRGLYLVYVSLPAGDGAVSNYTAYAIIAFDTVASRILQQTDGITIYLTLSGNNIQVRQNSGAIQSVEYRLIKIV